MSTILSIFYKIDEICFMQNFLLSNGICDEIDKVSMNFLWSCGNMKGWNLCELRHGHFYEVPKWFKGEECLFY